MVQAIIVDALLALIIVARGNAAGTLAHWHPVTRDFFRTDNDVVIAIFVSFELCVVQGGANASAITFSAQFYGEAGVGRPGQVAANTITVLVIYHGRVIACIGIVAEQFLVLMDKRREERSGRVRLQPVLEAMQKGVQQHTSRLGKILRRAQFPRGTGERDFQLVKGLLQFCQRLRGSAVTLVLRNCILRHCSHSLCQ